MKQARLHIIHLIALPVPYHRHPLTLLSLALTGLSACSPYNFSREVGAFGAGVDQLSSGFTSGYATLTADRAALLELQLTSTRSKVALANSCLALPSSSPEPEPAATVPCALYPADGSAPKLSQIEQKRRQTTEFLKALQDYAHALVAVTNAADRAAYDAAVAQLASAVGTIAKAAGPQGAAASTVAPAAVNLLGWVVGQGLDRQRFDSLRAGVTVVNTPLPDGKIPISYVAGVAGDGLYALALAQRAVLVEEINLLRPALGPALTDAAYRQRLSDAEAVVAALDALRHSHPTAAAMGLVKAHDALAAAVNDPSRNYPNLVKAVEEFADQAKALQAALTAAPAAKSTAAK